MRTRSAVLCLVALVGAAGCGRAQEANPYSEAYGYSDTVATVDGPPPTQPPDPASLASPPATIELGLTPAETVPGAEPTTDANDESVTTVAADSDANNLNGAPLVGPSGMTLAAAANPACVIQTLNGDTVATIVDRLVGVTPEELRSENGLGVSNEPVAGELLDVCIGNDVFDIYGTSRIPPSGDYAKQLQTALNRLLESTSMLELTVDGDAGKLTQQATCAARSLIGLPVSTGYPIVGSAEYEALTTATRISVPEGAPTDADRWLLIDKTCQVMFAGERDVLIDVYPTSTGAPGYATENGDFVAHRFDPALESRGWHDSTAYPTGEDDPNNGNMYKPIYFNENEAIHGAGYIPPEPRSKGCARTFPQHQDKIIEWLGIDDITEETWRESRLGLRVMVRGNYLTPAGEALPEPETILLPAYEQTDTTVADDS